MNKTNDDFFTNLQWILNHFIALKRTFLALESIENNENKFLYDYGDIFGVARNSMMQEVLLGISKLVIPNKDSISIPYILDKAGENFNKKFFKDNIFSSLKELNCSDEIKGKILYSYGTKWLEETDFFEKSYCDYQKKLEFLSSEFAMHNESIIKLRKIRNKMLAHIDRRINEESKIFKLIDEYPIYQTDLKVLLEMIEWILVTLLQIFKRVTPDFVFKDYDFELRAINKSIKYFNENEL